MRILVLGGAGFIGSHLCERLLGEGHRVIAMDNYITGARRNVNHLLGHAEFSLIENDVTVSCDVDEPLDAVMNLASPASPVGYLDNPIETMKVGSHGTYNALELAVRKNARFLMASTSEVYGDPKEHPQKESYWGHVNSIGVRSVYDEAKRFAEALTMAYHRKHNLRTRILRIFNTYGPRMDPNDGRVISNFITQALRDQPITIYGEGTQTRSFCYCDDLIRGMMLMMEQDQSIGPVNIGNPGEYTMLQLAQEVLKAIPESKSTIEHVPLPQDDPKQRCPDITKAQTILGWSPEIDLRTGLARTVEYYRAELARA